MVRWEKTTRPFLRGKEFLWQEGHTVHATKEEAMEETLLMLNVYEQMGRNLLAIPFVTGLKTEKEKFAGAEKTYSIEALMHDGKALQSGTTHYFGNGFAKAFDISFQDDSNELVYAYQSSWGVSTRLIGAIIMVHGDDEGLVLPPYVAPVQVVAIPIASQNEIVREHIKIIDNILKETDLRYLIDDSDRRPGWKFSEYEMKGIPIRIEFGPRDLENNQVTIVKRNNREKISVKIEELGIKLPELLDLIHEEMLAKANEHLNNNLHTAKSYLDFKELLKKGGYIKMSINQAAEAIIKEETGATARVILENEPLITKLCPVTNEVADYTILFAKAY